MYLYYFKIYLNLILLVINIKMDFYNTKYICTYNDSDVFLDSELEVLTEDEKYFIREALYRRDICNIFNIEDQDFDEKLITSNISKLYKIIKGETFLKQCITKISNSVLYNSDFDLFYTKNILLLLNK